MSRISNVLLAVLACVALPLIAGAQGNRDRSQSGFTAVERETIAEYFSEHTIEVEPLPPGIAKRLERGKALPPGVAKRQLPGPRSADGTWLYFAADNVPGRTPTATVFRLSLVNRTAAPEPITQLAMPMRYGRVSPNGLWLAYQPRNRVEIRIVPLGAERVTAEDSRLLSPAGGNTGFGFTRDGSAVIYGDGSRAWSLPVSGDEPDEIPIRLAIERPVPPPVLLQRVRVLDYDMGGFGAETSMLIAGGRIQSVSAEASLPPGTVVLNAGGRFAIPGLFDMHTHACSWSVFIPYGITSVRHMGGTSGAALHGNLADRSTFTGAAVPRCFYAGPILQSPQSPRGGSRGNVA